MELHYRTEADAGLGDVRADFSRNATMNAIGVLLGLGFAAAGVATIVFGKALDVAPWIAWLGGATFTSVGLWVLALMVRNWNLRLRVFERGFVHTLGARSVAVPWDEVAGLYVLGQSEYLVRTSKGEALKLAMFAGTDAMADLVVVHTRPRLLDAAVAAIERGEDASFGAVSARAEGLVCEGAVIPWQNLEPLDHAFSGAMLQLTDGRTHAVRSVALRDVANLQVLLELVARFKTAPAALPVAAS